ncbi:TrkH family potassium uptake protein [Rhodovulum sp. DZ06]|uniref:TrkH family potassium uptake protein n=1 Tax=Rhodovulum sp. DZ06 TaxID=3425126 RepID=UPI003D3376A2
MIDLRPPFYVIGLLTVLLGASMIMPLTLDFIDDDPNWRAFALSAFITILSGAAMALTCKTRAGQGLTLQQTFILTVFSWALLPVFGALPFMLGAPGASAADAYFEAMSGLTTTGSTVFTGLDALPPAVNLWRAELQWMGGLGIVVVALGFLPAMQVGGMQIFRSESFETFGKVLPRAGEIAASISWLYAALTALTAAAYAAAGQSAYDSVVHAFTTISTGGFATSDESFGDLGAASEYVAVVGMTVASLPFVRLIQLASGEAEPIWRDKQVRAFLAIMATITLVITFWIMSMGVITDPELAFRKALFNATSVLTGCGYASADYNAWGPFPAAIIFIAGMIGGCAGSTCCSVKVFRYQIVFAAIAAHIRRIHSPHGVFRPRYEGRVVDDELFGSVMSFMFMFFLTLGFVAVALGMMGYDTVTAVSGAATALANVGPGLGDIIGPAGNFAPLSDSAKWLLSAAMLVGRLELVSVYVLFTVAFWRK